MPGKNILVVEDDRISGAYIQNVLTRLGYDAPLVVDTGEDAVHKAVETRPDLVLMDIGLAGEMTGIQAAVQIREKTGIPLIYLTALSDAQTIHEAKVTGPFGFISKPFHEQVLHMAIEIAMYRHEMEERMRENEAWLKTILAGIGDAVVATDHKSRVRFMNPVAEKLTGWEEKEALGRYLDEIFHLIGGETGAPAQSPVGQAIRDKAPVSQKNHVLLVRRNGQTLAIEDSASPIRDVSGNVTGVVMVFREVCGLEHGKRSAGKSGD